MSRGGRGRGRTRAKQVPDSRRMSAYDRLQWCRRQWLDDPSISIQGPNGMIKLMKGTFGVAASYMVLHNLHDGVQKEMADRYRVEQEREARDSPKAKEPFNPPALRLSQIKALSKGTRKSPSAPAKTADSAPPIKYIVPDPEPAPEPTPAPSEPTPALRVVAPRKRAKRADFAERELFAMNQLSQRPHMPLSGHDGLNAMLRSRFGKGMSHVTLKALKVQILAELETPETLKSIMSAMPKKPVNEGPTDAEEAIRTAAELIQESIPNLREFVLTVDEDGKVHVSYKQYIIKTGEFVLDG